MTTFKTFMGRDVVGRESRHSERHKPADRPNVPGCGSGVAPRPTRCRHPLDRPCCWKEGLSCSDRAPAAYEEIGVAGHRRLRRVAFATHGRQISATARFGGLPTGMVAQALVA